MKAALLTEPFRFDVVDRPEPEPGAEEVLIRVQRVGICGSDVHIWRGEYVRDQLPRVPGHEFAGEVASFGEAVRGLKVGDAVTADINVGCGRCPQCLSDNAMLCPHVEQIGIHRDGAFAEYVVAPASHVVRLPGGMSASIGALAEPVGCAARSLRRCRLTAGQSLLVIGTGPMGMLHVQMAKALGAKPIVALEANPRLADMAKEYGASQAVSNLEKAWEARQALTRGTGFDVVVECVGKTELYEFGVKAVRSGGVLGCFGLEQADRFANIAPYDLVVKEKTMIGSVGATATDMKAAIECLTNGDIATEPFTETVFGLERIEDAFRAAAIERAALKVQIAP